MGGVSRSASRVILFVYRAAAPRAAAEPSRAGPTQPRLCAGEEAREWRGGGGGWGVGGGGLGVGLGLKLGDGFGGEPLGSGGRVCGRGKIGHAGPLFMG